MRLKTIHAPTMAEAMEIIRHQLGAEAIIVATHEDEDSRGVRVTAATESDDLDTVLGEEPPVDVVDVICAALDDHGTPPRLADRILNAVAKLATSEPALALAGALDAVFSFMPLPERNGTRPLMLIGPPGTGKTSAVAKLAARAVLAQNPVCLITTDTVRACAADQLKAYATRLGLPVAVAPDPVALIEALDARGPDDLVVIDTMSTNPYNTEDMGRLTDFVSAASVEPILVLAAGRDAVETVELVSAFAEAAPKRLLVTGLDMAHRLGSMLAAADSGKLPFSDVSPTPNIVNGLRPINPVSLARLLLPASHSGTEAEDPAGAAGPLEATGSE